MAAYSLMFLQDLAEHPVTLSLLVTVKPSGFMKKILSEPSDKIN